MVGRLPEDVAASSRNHWQSRVFIGLSGRIRRNTRIVFAILVSSWLNITNITDKEQKQLQTIIGRDEKVSPQEYEAPEGRRASGMMVRGD